MLKGEKLVKASDVRAHLVLAHTLRDGWLALSSISNNPMVCTAPTLRKAALRTRVSEGPLALTLAVAVSTPDLVLQAQKYAKRLKPSSATNADFLAAFSRELLQSQQPPPSGLSALTRRPVRAGCL